MRLGGRPGSSSLESAGPLKLCRIRLGNNTRPLERLICFTSRSFQALRLSRSPRLFPPLQVWPRLSCDLFIWPHLRALQPERLASCCCLFAGRQHQLAARRRRLIGSCEGLKGAIKAAAAATGESKNGSRADDGQHANERRGKPLIEGSQYWNWLAGARRARQPVPILCVGPAHSLGR